MTISHPFPSLPAFQYPPSRISPPTSHLPPSASSSSSLKIPTIWRCGTCASNNPILSLLTQAPTAESTTCDCLAPSLQAVYDQFGDIYLFWRDDPAVANLRDPEQAREARWRVWRAGGGVWERLGLDLEVGDFEAEGEPRDGVVLGEGIGEAGEKEEIAKRPMRRWSGDSQSSVASDESEDSVC
ncbi:hypothetical protein VTI74DRAFT_2971 [Chaetomium olivicolor]